MNRVQALKADAGKTPKVPKPTRPKKNKDEKDEEFNTESGPGVTTKVFVEWVDIDGDGIVDFKKVCLKFLNLLGSHVWSLRRPYPLNNILG